MPKKKAKKSRRINDWSCKSPSIKRADELLKQERYKQFDCVYAATGITLWRYLGWRVHRISDLYEETVKDWKNIEENVSIFQTLEDETGIEISKAENSRGWRDYMFFNSEIDDYGDTMTAPQYIAMRNSQREWMREMYVAGVLLALHSRHGFGAERLHRFFTKLYDVFDEFGDDRKKLVRALHDETGIVLTAKGIYAKIDSRRLGVIVSPDNGGTDDNAEGKQN